MAGSQANWRTIGKVDRLVQLVVDRESQTPIYVQIARQLRQSILDGEPVAGARLPPERRLAALLGVNRTTIVNAYRELAADGLVSGQVGRGTIVTYGAELAGSSVSDVSTWPRLSGRQTSMTAEHGGRDPDVSGPERRRIGASPLPWAHLFTPVTDVMDDPMLRDAMTVSARPDVIRLATGIPSPELYPVEAIRSMFNEALDNAGQTLLQHTPTEGYPPLREQLALWMERSAAGAGAPYSVDPSQIVVVAGSQQGLYLLARTLIEPGDLVAIESPTYLGAAQVFRAAGARLLPIPIDQDGMQVDLLQEILPRRRPKLIYTLPTFQNPSGAVMSMGRRLRLIDLAARYQIPIIEDDPYGALRYEGRSLPTIAAIDRSEGRANVIYLSTVSKMLFPGFRIGWICAPKPVVERLTLMKQLVDLDTNALAQWAVWAFFERGMLDAHLVRVNQVYPARRDRMLAALERHGEGLIASNRPGGGIYLWCRLHEAIRVRDLLPEAAREGVIFAPGESFHVDAASGRGRFDIRLNYTLPTETEIDEGIRRLGIALRRLADHYALGDRATHAGNPLTPIV
ncbi:MAG TPA: PLP-dependent aminotransferase family protein [Thermomicrobiales bacterium]|nr:PLP-dependent aminotransferase family protein [Thermomicrobiales bacterium]